MDIYRRPFAALEWALVGSTVLTYLLTVSSDPGFLRPKSSKHSRQSLGPLGGVLCCCLCAPCQGIAVLRRRIAGLSTTKSANGSERTTHNAHDDHEARELQPIGRATLDLVGNEAESDPGEETIEPADLEIGTAVVNEGCSKKSSGDDCNSLGAVPGTPRQGTKGKRRKPTTVGNASNDPYADVHGGIVLQSGHRLRYCRVCLMHQPLRTKHCHDCGRCVRTHDHHCPWVGTCVGEGNRLWFFWFLLSQCLELAVFFLEGCLSLLRDGFNLASWLNRSPVLFLGLIVIGLLLSMVSCLLCFHIYLAASNMTSWENLSWHNISYLRRLPPEDGSPFSVSLSGNVAAYCCPPWCPDQGCGCGKIAQLKRTEDGWAIWELGEPHSPLDLDCSNCGVCFGPEDRCNPCVCFNAY